MTWLSEVKDPKSQVVLQVKTTSSTKGIILVTEEYECFLFNSSKEKRFLLQALEVWINNPEGFGKEIIVIPTKTARSGFELGHRDITCWKYESSTGTYKAGHDVEVEEDVNPFLLDTTQPTPTQLDLGDGSQDIAGYPRRKRKS